MDAILGDGQHAVIYGERGVGKTSLTSIIAEKLRGVRCICLRTNCDGTDNFSSIWNKLIEDVEPVHQQKGMGLAPETREVRTNTALLLTHPDAVTPNDARRALAALGRGGRVIVFVDEFDRLADQQARTLFADTVKLLSDRRDGATLILVGVADNVGELIAEHRSVERALVQIHMPRMSQTELIEIIRHGMSTAQMTIDGDAQERITRLSQGLPHYTHLIAQAAARAALDDARIRIQLTDAEAAIDAVLNRSQQSIIDAYHQATFSTRDTLYKQVLLACALAPVDDLGYFAAGDVRAPLSSIMKAKYDIPAFARHLNSLCDGERGPILEKAGTQRKFRFRFLDPLLQPYIIMRGLSERMISPDILGTQASDHRGTP